MQRYRQIIAACFLLGVCIAGALQSARAAVAQIVFHHAKYGSGEREPVRLGRLCETASRWYGYNYYFCILVSQAAYAAAVEKPADEDALRALAARWTDRGLALNPYRRQLCLIKTYLLENESREEAIRHWREYLEWHFWDHYNHWVLFGLHVRGGAYREAMQSMEWLKGSEYAERARRSLRRAWQREMAFPDLGVEP